LKWPSHGSNPQYLFKAMGLRLPEDYLDFSANINPLGPPSCLQENWNELYRHITVYPDPYAAKLKTKIAGKEQIPLDSILIGNGGAELITLIARMLAGKKVLLIHPTFSEYEEALSANNCEILYEQLTEPDFTIRLPNLFSKLRQADALIFCNPNNPTGVKYSESTVISIIEECDRQNKIVIIDEAFYDFLIEYESMIPHISKFSNLILIRSMTKMYSIPGVRLGYLVATPSIIHKLSRLQSHWSVNTIALFAGEWCLEDEDFIQNTKYFIRNERDRLSQFFQQYQYIVSNSMVNFYLLRDSLLEDQFALFEFLLKKGIIPRHTFNFPGLEGRWLRFAIKSYEENTRLMEVLAEWRSFHH